MVRHKNDYGYWENVDRLPIPGCACNKCINAADREAQRSQRRGRRGGAGRAAEGLVAGAAFLGGLAAQPPADNVMQAGDAYDQARQGLVENRDEYLDEQTRAANDRKGGSSKRRR